MKQNLFVPPEMKGIELDDFLSLRFPGVPKGRLRRLIREGKVSVNGVVEASFGHLGGDALVIVELPEDGLPAVRGAPGELPILYEDEAVLCVDKPADLAVEPERWRKEAPTVASVLLGMGLPYRPRIAHRLDKGTSGALLLAKDLEAERALRRQFERREVEKEYWAIVEGEVPGEGGEVDLPVGPDPTQEGRMRVERRKGDPAQTAYRVIERFRGYTVLAAFPRAGRTHQIRVHLAARGFPLAVDPLYGRQSELLLSRIKPDYRRKRGLPETPLLGRLSLHARRLGFRSPAAGPVAVESPLPKDLEIVLGKLRRYRRLP